MKREGKRTSQAFIPMGRSLTTQPKAFDFIPKPEGLKQRDEKLEFPFSVANRKVDLSSLLRIKNLKPLMS